MRSAYYAQILCDVDDSRVGSLRRVKVKSEENWAGLHHYVLIGSHSQAIGFAPADSLGRAPSFV